MAATGPQWSLYPLLALVAFCTFCLSCAHVLACLPLHALCAPLAAGIVGLLAAFHAIFLRYPNRTDFVLQVITSIVSLVFFLSSALETLCLSRSPSDASSGDICAGLTYRTESMVESCNSFFQRMQEVALSSANWELPSVRIFISSCLTVLAGSQLVISIALSFYSAHETKLRIRTFHYQLALGGLLILIGLFHWRFCCLYYFIGAPAICGTVCILQGLAEWKHPSTRLSRSLDVIGTLGALTLFSSMLFSLLCTVSSIFSWHLSILRHCHWGGDRMKGCRRALDFSYPYFNWEAPQIDHEVTSIQLVLYSVLLVISVGYFYCSIKSTFKLRKQKQANVFFTT